MKILFLLVLLQISSVFTNENKHGTIRKDVEDQVNALLKKMTLEEKLGQLQQLDGEANGNYRPIQVELAKKGLLGSTLNVRGARRVNELQTAAKESRLKIPILMGFDVIHGYRTLFPIPLGEAASFDLEAAERSAAIAAEESSSVGLHWTFAPMIDIGWDARWGRVMEGAGEDVFLGAKMAEARIRGFQGSDYSQEKNIMACAKHFVAYGGVEAGREYNTVDVSERRLREVHLPPFKAAVDAGVGSIMTAFNDLNGVPATANKWILRNILRDEWKFDGLVVSDYNSVLEMVNHGLAASTSEAAMYGLNGGTDMEMVSTTYNQNGEYLLNSGKVTNKTIDDAVKNVLRVKYRLGLFDRPPVNESLEALTLLKPEFLQVAREIAAKSFVLLKNDNNVLPISTQKIKTLAVIGALADDKPNSLDWWAGDARADDVVTFLQGIKDRAENSTNPINVTFAKGCESVCNSSSDFNATVEQARDADFVIIVVGETREISAEAGSRTNIDLPGLQLDLIKEISKIGKPYVVVVKTGRPLTLGWIAENAPAILITWHPGTMGGAAVADVLFGIVNPSAKLPMTFPRNVGQIPIHYDAKNTGRPFNPNDRYTSKYVDSPNTPLYPFGFGLSYTTFEFRNLTFAKSHMTADESQTVSVEVLNTGIRDGTEVAQLYIRDLTASITRPVRQLRGFKRVFLKVGEQQTVTFILGKDELGFLDEEMKMVVEPGVIQVFVGGSSLANLTAQFDVISQTTQAASTVTFSGSLFILTSLFSVMGL